MSGRATTIDTIPEGASVAIYGAGDFGAAVLDRIREQRKDLRVLTFLDSHKESEFCGLPVARYDRAPLGDALVLICSSHHEQIAATLTAAGCPAYLVMDNLTYFPPKHHLREDIEICQAVKDYTMTSALRVKSLLDAVAYIEKQEIPGDVVECGVWAGGSMMAVALKLMRLGNRSRVLHLFDTFAGMTEPTREDATTDGKGAADKYRELKKDDYCNWCYCDFDSVRRNMDSTGYAPGNVRLVKGDVLDTIPGQAPEKIALLRLDTDFYKSTRHEMIHLFPRLSRHGILIIDDYNYWKGSHQAVDEYLDQHGIRIFLHAIDTCGVIGVKLTD